MAIRDIYGVGRIALAAALLGLSAPALAHAEVAARAAAKAEGTLAEFENVDRDAKDPAAVLKILQQDLYETEAYAIENQFLLQYGDRISMRTIRYASGHDLIPGHIFTPKHLAAGKKYPAIVVVHGGFHGSFDRTWYQIVDTLVEQGYVLFFPEYRSSRGYGPDTYKNDYGVTDVADVFAGADYFETLPYVDKARLGILGESRGGMITVSAIEQKPQRFKVAVDVVGLMDFVAYMAYKPNYRRDEVARESPSFEGKLPDRNLQQYINVSPINFVEKIQTPVLVIGTKGDESVPVSYNAERLVSLLKLNNKAFDAKIYDNAPGGHEMMSAQTPERYDATDRIVRWLGRYLKSE
ncbi:alpha/beta hydrolase family protein [Phenylobacterium sp.]|uniref:alpha/beta hydrolase family protein n=1 Tax=Phenylobacterium sp. TaxID=1871053 RepID=UPI002F3FC718